MVKNLAANAGDVRLGFDPWVERVPWRRALATRSSTLAPRIPWTEEPGRLQSVGVTKSQMRLKQLSTHALFTKLRVLFRFHQFFLYLFPDPP